MAIDVGVDRSLSGGVGTVGAHKGCESRGNRPRRKEEPIDSSIQQDQDIWQKWEANHPLQSQSRPGSL